jgi:cyclase
VGLPALERLGENTKTGAGRAREVRMWVRACATTLALTLLGPVHSSAEDRPTPVGRDVFVVTGDGGNVGVLATADGVLLVDTATWRASRRLPERVRLVTEGRVRFVVNTHFHADHVQGNDLFASSALIIAHDTVPERMRAFHAQVLRDYPALLETARGDGNQAGAAWLSEQLDWARSTPAERLPTPALTYASELTLRLGDETVHIWHPGRAHTDGDSLVYCERAKVLHAGDILFNRIIPYMDAAEGSSVSGWIAALDDVLRRVQLAERKLRDVKVIPGHGEVSSLSGVREFRGYLADLLEAARQAKASGQSLEQFKQTVALPAYAHYADYALRLKDNAAVAYAEVP